MEKKAKRGQVEKLIDKRGGYNRGICSIPTEYQNYFKNLYLQQTKPTLQSCFYETKLKANKNGDIIPGVKAFKNLVDNMGNALLIRHREGEKAFHDKCVPHIERDYSGLDPNDMWVADHHLWDIFVKIPDNKGGWKVVRPWGSYWMDMRTRKVMSSIVRIEAPNSDIVLCSFGIGVEQFGIPKRVYLDNGKDYKSKDLFTLDDKNKIADSLAINLQIDVTFAIPYNAQAKPIERMFNTYEEQLGKKYPSYAGKNAKERPEDLKNLDIDNMITLEEFIVNHDKYVYEIYNESSHSGDSMFHQSPNQMYSKLPFVLRKTSKESLYFSLMRLKGTRTVQKNGITFNHIHFYNDNCINYISKKVIAKYDPSKPEILYIFDIHENFLFVATKISKKGFALTEEDYHEENHRKKIAKQKALNSYTPDNTIRSTERIGERLEILSESIVKSEVANPTVIEVIRNEKLEEAARRMNCSDIEKNYEDVLNRQKADKKKSNDRQQQLTENFIKKMNERADARQA